MGCSCGAESGEPCRPFALSDSVKRLLKKADWMERVRDGTTEWSFDGGITWSTDPLQLADQHVCDDECRDARAALARESFVPPCFELGAQWRSFDGGLTWERFPDARRTPTEGASMTVTAIDVETGAVTVKVNG